MNKLLFKYDRDYDKTIVLIANNHKDLEDYLRATYDWYSITIIDNNVHIVERPGYSTDYIDLIWVKQV